MLIVFEFCHLEMERSQTLFAILFLNIVKVKQKKKISLKIAISNISGVA